MQAMVKDFCVKNYKITLENVVIVDTPINSGLQQNEVKSQG